MKSLKSLKSLISILVIFFTLAPINGFAKENLLNDLDCSNYIEASECNNIYSYFKDQKIDKYHLVTFDNQLKKITYLLNKNKDKIAEKKFNYFFEILEEEVNDKTELYKNKDNLWALLNSYSKSNEYTSNPKYNLK